MSVAERITCIAVDDEPPALNVLRSYTSRIAALDLLQVFDDAISAAKFLQTGSVDLLFLDINMPDITGIDLVRSLEKIPLIIFTTAYKNFAFEGFELEAVDYLLKPISFERFSKAVNKAITVKQQKELAKNKEDEYLFVRSEYRMIKIDINTIEFIEGLEDYIKIHILNARPILTLMTLKSVIEKLPPNKFKRIHRSYIVSTGKVVSILNKKLMLSSSKELPISDSYIDFVNEWMNTNF